MVSGHFAKMNLHLIWQHAEIPGLGPWLRGYVEELKSQQGDGVTVSETPETATHILFLECGKRRDHVWAKNYLARHPLVRAFPDKCYVWCTEDNAITWLPGIYVSMPKQFFDPSLHRAFRYFNLNTEQLPVPAERDRDIFYSFLGGPSSPLRAAIHRMSHPADSLVLETLNYNHGRYAQGSALNSYVQVLARSQFTLCPAGAGTSSYRLFEAMRAGSVPVILSDNLVLPQGPRWVNCSIRIEWKNLPQLPEILRAIPDPATIGRNAQEDFQKFFSAERMLQHIARELNALGKCDVRRARRRFRHQLWIEGAGRVCRRLSGLVCGR